VKASTIAPSSVCCGDLACLRLDAQLPLVVSLLVSGAIVRGVPSLDLLRGRPEEDPCGSVEVQANDEEF
jgi:hypothetical protein